MLTHISLFAGIGCESIAAEWAGFETIFHVEIDKDCQKVLRKYWPDVPIIEDVRDVTRESVIANTNYRFNFRPKNKIQARRGSVNHGNQLTLLSAGCPCQSASGVGKRRGKADDRWLWPEAIRVLNKLQPTYACFENPTGIASLGEYGSLFSVGNETDKRESDNQTDEFWNGLPDREAVELSNIIRDIEKEGYEVQPVSIPACSVGAPHERQRIFIVCHSRICGLSGESRRRTGQESQDGCVGDESGINTNAELLRCQKSRQPGTLKSSATLPSNQSGIRYNREYWRDNWYNKAIELCSPKTKSGVRSLDDGSATGLPGLNISRTTKLKMLGNCNPPQLYYPIFKAIADIEVRG